MTANYSKGEWIPYQRKSNNVSICVKSSDKEVVVVEVASLNTLLGYGTVVANASLIASAPDMYEALQAVLGYAESLRNNILTELANPKEGTHTAEEYLRQMQNAYNALAKAEGRNV